MLWIASVGELGGWKNQVRWRRMRRAATLCDKPDGHRAPEQWDGDDRRSRTGQAGGTEWMPRGAELTMRWVGCFDRVDGEMKQFVVGCVCFPALHFCFVPLRPTFLSPFLLLCMILTNRLPQQPALLWKGRRRISHPLHPFSPVCSSLVRAVFANRTLQHPLRPLMQARLIVPSNPRTHHRKSNPSRFPKGRLRPCSGEGGRRVWDATTSAPVPVAMTMLERQWVSLFLVVGGSSDSSRLPLCSAQAFLFSPFSLFLFVLSLDTSTRVFLSFPSFFLSLPLVVLFRSLLKTLLFLLRSLLLPIHSFSSADLSCFYRFTSRSYSYS
jgi:hypothetical protein